ncbi:glycoside hydrolase family 16 protein [Anaeromyxobacter terrae]|uniref:glycoside hydrolase family 16 protein n=1 Tax=Anaeromyxobacter terrae TaxID=2925406 RepID=UPI001F59B330|nr:glycoside hydrolase family 16 protein [Anaeromyxobacter sp. SG22]
MPRPAGYDVLAYAEEFDGPDFPAQLSRVGGIGFAAPYDSVAELQRFEPGRAELVRGLIGIEGSSVGALALRATWDVAAGEYLSGEVVSSASHCPMQNSTVPAPCAGTRWGSGVRFASTPAQGVYLEVCARLPLVGGNWPAVWMLRDEGAGFAPPEFDLVEAFPGRPLPFCQTEHVVDASHEECVQLVPDRFYAYAVLWDPAHGTVEFFINGVATYAPQAIPDFSAAWANDASGGGYPAYFVLTHALSNEIAGAFPTMSGSATTYVDYVRVYTNGPADVIP